MIKVKSLFGKRFYLTIYYGCLYQTLWLKRIIKTFSVGYKAFAGQVFRLSYRHSYFLKRTSEGYNSFSAAETNIFYCFKHIFFSQIAKSGSVLVSKY